MTPRSMFTKKEIQAAIETAARAASVNKYSAIAAQLTLLGRGAVTRQLARHWAKKFEGPVDADEGAQAAGRVTAPDQRRRVLHGERFIVTAAQNNTRVHFQFFKNLEAYTRSVDGQLIVSQFSYNKAAWQRGGQKNDEDLWYDPITLPYVMNAPAEIAGTDIIIGGELDILPTAVNPITGLTTYAREKSLIVPHAKVQMQSVATPKAIPPKFIWTTGACTTRNYIDSKAGRIADFHHVFGAVLVETDGKSTFVRQLICGEDGSFYDLDKLVDKGKVQCGQTVQSVTAGDIHIGKPDHDNYHLLREMCRALAPKYVVLHDLLDFTARNHHSIKKPMEMYRVERSTHRGTIDHELKEAAIFLRCLGEKSKAKIIVVKSNHDEAFDRWLDEADPLRNDPRNAEWWLRANLYRLLCIKDNEKEHADVLMHCIGDVGAPIKYLKVDESLLIKDVEHGMHGHYGPNGARGSAQNLSKIGRKANIGHAHSATIKDGTWVAGVLGSLDMGYNKGPSSWSPTNIITHKNGKRQMVTFSRTTNPGKWRL